MTVVNRRSFFAGFAAALAGLTASATAAEPGSASPLAAPDRVPEAIAAWRQQTRDLFHSADFAALDAAATEVRASKARFGNGGWKLFEFYDALKCPVSDLEVVSEFHLVAFRKWVAARPQSATARIALAEALVNFAWQARGGGFADTVTEQGWKLMGERLREADAVLKEARGLAEKCPHWWLAAQRVGIGLGWSREVYDKVFAEGVAFEPRYWHASVEKARYLLPRWHGQAGDWERFAEEETRRAGGPGAEIYPRIVVSLDRYHKHVFQESAATWPLTREGFLSLRTQYPASMEVAVWFCKLACRGNDRDQAQALFNEIGENVDLRFWKTQGAYDRYRRWAFP